MRRVLTPELFAEICYALHGPNWRTWAADRLGKSQRTIRRYENGDCNVPRAVKESLAQIIDEQIEVLNAYRGEFP